MGLFDSISEAVSNVTGGLGDQVNGAVEDVTNQIPSTDQVQDIIPGDESGGEEQE